MREAIESAARPAGARSRRVRHPVAGAELAKVGQELSNSSLHLAADLLRRSFWTSLESLLGGCAFRRSDPKSAHGPS